MSQNIFFQKEINYLGHIVGYGVIKIDPSRVERIRSLPIPSDKKAVKRFFFATLATMARGTLKGALIGSKPKMFYNE